MAYAGWITKGLEYKGDCLEMMCDCVEDDEGKGYCCPDGTAFNGKGDAHIEYTPCKCLGSNTYYNRNEEKCLEKPTCNPCQKFDTDKGQCVADTSKNNQTVGACGKCNNGSVVVDTTKVTPCKTCNTTNWTLTNKTNGTQAQDVCHMCKDGNVVLKDSTKQFISNKTCVACLANYNTGKTGACTTEAKPQCKNNTCQACPTGYVWNNNKKACDKKECNDTAYKYLNQCGGSRLGSAYSYTSHTLNILKGTNVQVKWTGDINNDNDNSCNDGWGKLYYEWYDEKGKKIGARGAFSTGCKYETIKNPGNAVRMKIIPTDYTKHCDWMFDVYMKYCSP